MGDLGALRRRGHPAGRRATADHRPGLYSGAGVAGGAQLSNGYSVQAASRAALADTGKVAAIGDYLLRLDKAYEWSDTHQTQWAQLWSQETGLPIATTQAAAADIVLHPVVLDSTLINSEQQLADEFATAQQIPGKISFADFVDTLRQRDQDLPGRIGRAMSITLHWFLPTSGDGRSIVDHAWPVARWTPESHASPTSTTWPRSPRRPSSSASTACSPRPAPGARTPG